MKSYIKIPKEIFTDPQYRSLSSNAKLLYGLLLDRRSLSEKNNLTDAEGKIVVYFTREEAREILGTGKDMITKYFTELKNVSLLYEGFIGIGKVRPLYLQNPTCQGDKCGTVRATNAVNNNTELNNTELNNTELNNYFENYFLINYGGMSGDEPDYNPPT